MTRRAKVAITAWAALAAAMLLAPAPARAFPAFARKYGLRCTACHESWPKLNDFGRAFRDNGYQMLTGKDDTDLRNTGLLAGVGSHHATVSLHQGDQPADRPGDKESRIRRRRPGRHGPLDGWSALPERVVPRRSDRIRAGRSRRPGVRLDPFRQPVRLVVGEPQARSPRGGPPSLGPPALEPDRRWLPHLQLPRLGLGVELRHGRKPVGPGVRGPRQGKRESCRGFGLQRPEFARERELLEYPRRLLPRHARVGVRQRSGFGVQARRFRLLYDVADDLLHERRHSDPRDGRQSRAVDEDRRGGPDLVWPARHTVPPRPRLRTRCGQPGPDPGRHPKRDLQRRLRRVRLDVHTEEPHLRAVRRLQELSAGRGGRTKGPQRPERRDLGWRHTFQFSNRSEYALHVEYSSLQTKGAGADGLNTRTNPYMVGIDFAY